MIRSIKVTTKYSNRQKKHSLECFQKEYSLVVERIINHIWNYGYINKNQTQFDSKKRQWNLDSNLNNEFLKQFDNGVFTQRMLQACGTQASSILRSCTDKNRRRQWMVSSLMKDKKNVSKLQSITNKERITIPNFGLLEPQIDSRFFDIKESDGEFDGFIQLRLFKNKTVNIPYKKHKKYLDFESKGRILNSIRLNKDCISLSFELPEVEKRTDGVTLGADQGVVTTLALSDGQLTKKNNHGYDLRDIMHVLARKKKGSRAFFKAQQHRKNYINWSINQLNLSDVKQINLEKLFQVGKGTNKGRFLSGFAYTLIKKKLESLAETEGFAVSEVDNSFRSQRCSNCSWTQKSSRKEKLFSCKHCGFATDADLNASKNLEEDRLPPVPKWVREEKRNRKGFFWNLSGIFDSSGEPIVPLVQKTC
jgi:transposase